MQCEGGVCVYGQSWDTRARTSTDMRRPPSQGNTEIEMEREGGWAAHQHNTHTVQSSYTVVDAH